MRALNKVLPGVMYAAYPLLAACSPSGMTGGSGACSSSGGRFVFVSVLRRCLNCPRPYEKLGITPLIGREGGGQSFPSRHAASAAVIAAAFWYILPAAGVVMSVLALMIAVIRPLGGLHFPKDVAAGVLIGAAAGIAGFWS